MVDLAPPTAAELLERMAGRRVVVIGDVMIDEWIWGSVSRISPEAPVPVVAVSNHSFTLGGAGNVAHNLRALGANVDFIAAVGDDPEADRVETLLAEIGIAGSGLVRLDDRPTTRKTRVVAHNQQVVRADWESTNPLSDIDRHRIIEKIAISLEKADAVVLSDYNKGLMSREIVEAALGCPLVVADPKPENVRLFAGVNCIAPNVSEAARASGIAIVDAASLERAGTALLDELGCRYVVVTRGEAGMSLFGRDGERADIPSVARTVFDVSGAGDTVVAVLTLALAARIPIATSVALANLAAGAVVAKLGTATASPAEIIALLQFDHDGR